MLRVEHVKDSWAVGTRRRVGEVAPAALEKLLESPPVHFSPQEARTEASQRLGNSPLAVAAAYHPPKKKEEKKKKRSDANIPQGIDQI